MTIYYVITMLSLAIGCFFPNSRTNKKQKKLYLIFVFALLAFLMGVRGETVGIDTKISNEFFYRISEEKSLSVYLNIINAAPIYSIYNKLLSLLCSEAWLLNTINAILINGCFAYFIYRYSDNAVFSVFCYITMYFYMFAFNGTRQMLANAICILAFCFLNDGRKLISVILVIMALGTHATCIVFLPMFLLCIRKIKTSIYKLLLIVLVLGCIFIKIFYKYILHLIFYILPAYKKYGEWLEDGRFQAQGRNVLFTLFCMCFLLLFVAIIWKHRDFRGNQCVTYWRLILPPAFGLMLGLIFYKNALISGRIILYYTCFMIVVFPNFIERFSKGKLLPYTVIGMCLLCLLFFQLQINYAGVVPYRTVW